MVAQEISGGANGAEALAHPKVREFVRARFAEHNKGNPGSSMRIKRILLMTEQPSVDGHEITDKGYVNQRATLERRRALVERLYEKVPSPEVIEIA
jgi:feruloyl-CoA synthase